MSEIHFITLIISFILVTCPYSLAAYDVEVTVSGVACDNLHPPRDKGAKLSSNHLFLAPKLSNYSYVSHFVF